MTPAAIAAPAVMGAQERGAIAGVVVSRESGEALPYSVVAIPTQFEPRFTTSSGTFTFSNLPSGPVLLRVRRLGYIPADVTIDVRAGSVDTVRVELSRIAILLGAVTVRAYAPCRNPGPPTTEPGSPLAIVFSQVRLNAEQYRLLAEAYPFDYAMEITRTYKERKTGETKLERRDSVGLDSRTFSWYRPGAVVARRDVGTYFNIPTLVDFADSTFLAEHCFHYAGREQVESDNLVRIDFVAAEGIHQPDVNGSIYLDPGTFQIKRSVLRLSKLPRVPGMTDLAVTTDYRELLPSIPVISHVWSVQSFARTKRDVDAVYEEHRMGDIQFLRGKPGEDRVRKP